MPSTHDGRTCRAANWLGIVAVQSDASTCDLVDVGSRDLRGAMEGHVIEAKVICQDEEDVRRLGFSPAERASGQQGQQGEQERHGS